MAGFAEYSEHDGVGLAALVRRKEVRPIDLVEEAIGRIERLNGRLNAVVRTRYERARAEAMGPLGDGPFAGVPLLLKDLLATCVGEPMSSGSRLFDGWVAPRDSEIVARLKRAGFIVIGQTNTPELGLTPVTEPERFGPTRNPWDPARTAGGSSGGAGAAVAARMVPIAGGGDGGGSLRIPAACCGVFGLKPTRARTPAGPDRAEGWNGFTVEHVLTRSVRDSAAVLDVLHGPDVGAPYAAPAPARPFLEEVGAPVGRLRIAYSARPPMDVAVDPVYVRFVEETARLCRELGHEVVEAAPEIDGEAFARDFLVMLLGETAADLRDGERALGRPLRRGDIEPGTAVLDLLARSFGAFDYALALRDLRRVGRPVGRFFERYDVLLTPALAKPPLRVGEMMPRGLQRQLLLLLTGLRAGRTLRRLGALDEVVRSAWSFTPFTALFNATGQPAMSVPLGLTPEGLPLGAQFAGRYGDEATLFRLAAELEAARPWGSRRPPGV